MPQSQARWGQIQEPALSTLGNMRVCVPTSFYSTKKEQKETTKEIACDVKFNPVAPNAKHEQGKKETSLLDL